MISFLLYSLFLICSSYSSILASNLCSNGTFGTPKEQNNSQILIFTFKRMLILVETLYLKLYYIKYRITFVKYNGPSDAMTQLCPLIRIFTVCVFYYKFLYF